MTWHEVEKKTGTVGDMTYEIGTCPPDSPTEPCGYLRCTVTLVGLTTESVMFNMSVGDLQIASGRTCRVGGETVMCLYRCAGLVIEFHLAFPDKLDQYGENDGWAFKQVV